MLHAATHNLNRAVLAVLCTVLAANLPATAADFVEASSDAGGRAAGAADLGVLSGTVEIAGNVGGGDRNDAFQFSVATPTTLAATLTGLTQNAGIALFGGGRRALASSSEKGTADKTLSAVIDPGDYILKVSRNRGAATDYTLTITATLYTPPPITPPDSDDGAGGRKKKALDIGDLKRIINEQAVIDGSLDAGESADFYSFELSSADSVSIALSNLQADVQFTLLEDGGRRARQIVDTQTTGLGEALFTALEPGKYYIRIQAASAVTTPYTLTVATAGATPPDDDPPDADPPADDPPADDPPADDPPADDPPADAPPVAPPGDDPPADDPPADDPSYAEFRDDGAGIYGIVIGRTVVLVGVDAIVAGGPVSVNVEYGEVTVDGVVVTPKRTDSAQTLGYFIGATLYTAIPQDIRDRASSYVVLSSGLGTVELTLWSRAASPASPQRVLLTWDAAVTESFVPAVLGD